MESLKVRGLYFAGEVLDLDANTGGYNLQIAFSIADLLEGFHACMVVIKKTVDAFVVMSKTVKKCPNMQTSLKQIRICCSS